MKQAIAICLMAVIGGNLSCSSGKRTASGEASDNGVANVATVSSGTISRQPSAPTQAGPPVVVYKTTKDYSRNVPVGLSADGTRIVSYPAVSDVRGLPYPTPLADGYLLDNRGIGRNVAFLSYTYEEYAALPATPSPEELMEKVIDKHPLLEIHFLGNRYQYKDITRELNERIEAGELR